MIPRGARSPTPYLLRRLPVSQDAQQELERQNFRVRGSGGTADAVVQVVRDDRVETRRVTVGLLAAGQAEIREGVAEGEMVISRSGAFVRDGDRVRAVGGGAASMRK